MLWTLFHLEFLHLVFSLAHPTEQDPPHAFHRTLSQLIRFASVVVNPLVRLVETPDGHCTVNAVPHIAVILVPGQTRKEPCSWALEVKQLSFHLAIKLIKVLHSVCIVRQLDRVHIHKF